MAWSLEMFDHFQSVSVVLQILKSDDSEYPSNIDSDLETASLKRQPSIYGSSAFLKKFPCTAVIILKELDGKKD